MTSDQKIGVALLIALAGFATALGFGRKPSSDAEPQQPTALQLADDAFLPPVQLDDPFATATQTPNSVTHDSSESVTAGGPSGSLAEPPTPRGTPLVESPRPRTSAHGRSVPSDRRGEELPSLAGPVQTDVSTQTPRSRFREYTVQPGDTLSGIAEKETGRVGGYFDLYEANRDRLESPDSLRIGQQLRIPLQTASSDTEARH